MPVCILWSVLRLDFFWECDSDEPPIVGWCCLMGFLDLLDLWLLRRLLLGRVIFFLNQEIPAEDVGVNETIPIGLVVVVVVF